MFVTMGLNRRDRHLYAVDGSLPVVFNLSFLTLFTTSLLIPILLVAFRHPSKLQGSDYKLVGGRGCCVD